MSIIFFSPKFGIHLMEREKYQLQNPEIIVISDLASKVSKATCLQPAPKNLSKIVKK